MKTIGRNDPCPCGSGKKYKKCCLDQKDNVIDFIQEKNQRGFYSLHDKLLTDALKSSKATIRDLMLERLDIISFTKDQFDYILEACYCWIAFHLPVSGQKTPAELYMEKEKLSSDDRSIVQSWTMRRPSIYQIENHTDNQCTLIDLFDSKDKTVVELDNAPNSMSMDGFLLIGTILPYKDKFFVNGPPIFTPIHDIESILFHIQSIGKNSSPIETLTIHFPEIIQEVFKLLYANESVDELNDDHDLSFIEREVWTCFEQNTKGVFPEDTHHELYELWLNYCQHMFPQITKAESFAAGLEYVGHTYFEERRVTQKELAKKYGVTASTISNRNRSFMEFIEEVQPELEIMSYLREDIDEEMDITDHADFFFKRMMEEKEKLGHDFINQNKGHLWMIPEARPYMTAKLNYAQLELELSERKFALELLRELLVENPMDNQGVRYVLLPQLIKDGLYEEAHALITEFDDTTANFAFNKALLEYKETRNFDKVLERLTEAHSVNPHVRDFMLNIKKLPPPPEYIGIGDESEAIEYVVQHFDIWIEEEPLIALLAQLK